MQRKKIMLADDVELFLELEKTFFQREEIDLVIARTGQQALDLARSEAPDLIFMDLFMPELSGHEACRLIKQQAALQAIPVVMVTQGARDADLALCRDAGCDEILHKPINRHLFVETARRFLAFEPRRALRVDTRLQVRYGVDPASLATDMLLNLGERGVFIVTSTLVPIASRLHLEFTLPDSRKTIRCRGDVVWLNTPGRLSRPKLPAGMGLSFVDLQPPDQEAVREFIKQECLSPSW